MKSIARKVCDKIADALEAIIPEKYNMVLFLIAMAVVASGIIANIISIMSKLFG